MNTTTTRETLKTIRDETCSMFVERTDFVDAIILGLLTRNHVSVVSPPGAAKSGIAREIFSRINDANIFDVLLSKSRSDQAVLGPYNLPKLRDEGKFVRNTTGYLPTADYALLDEGSKMSPTIGHDILGILNERIYHEVNDNGTASTTPVPLKTAVVTGNEAFTAQGDDAAALWDRLLIRVHLDYVSSAGFARMLTANTSPVARTTITMGDLVAAADEVDKVVVPTSVVKKVVGLRKSLHGEGLIASDRRWRHSMSVIKAAAWLGARTTATANDVQSLRYTLWNEVGEIQQVTNACMDVSDPHSSRINEILSGIKTVQDGLTSRQKAGDTAKLFAFAAEASGKIRRAKTDLEAIRKEIEKAGDTTDQVNDALVKIDAAQAELFTILTGGEGS